MQLKSDALPLCDIEGGAVEGSGNIFAPITDNGGNVEGGTDTIPGILDLDAPLAQGSGSTMTAVTGGLTAGAAPGTFSQVNNSSSVALGGTLNLKFLNGFSPKPTNTFNILNFASSSGSFSSVKTPSPTVKPRVR